MKHLRYIWIFLLAFAACEEVIEVDTPSEPPRLIIEGLIRVDTTEQYIPVEVKFSLTSDFFGSATPTQVESAQILIERFDEYGTVIASGTSSLAEREPGSGVYVPDPNFSSDQRIATSVVTQDVLFTLLVRHEDQLYLAPTRYAPAVPIDTLVQGDGVLFEGDETEVIVTFTDDPDRNDFYLFDFDFDEFLVTEDEFYQGQQFSFSYFYDKNLEDRQEIDISIIGATEQFYNYMNQLIVQAGDFQGPFQTPVATVRGNIINATDIDNRENFDNVGDPNNFALGYFAISQEFKASITINK